VLEDDVAFRVGDGEGGWLPGYRFEVRLPQRQGTHEDGLTGLVDGLVGAEQHLPGASQPYGTDDRLAARGHGQLVGSFGPVGHVETGFGSPLGVGYQMRRSGTGGIGPVVRSADDGRQSVGRVVQRQPHALPDERFPAVAIDQANAHAGVGVDEELALPEDDEIGGRRSQVSVVGVDAAEGEGGNQEHSRRRQGPAPASQPWTGFRPDPLGGLLDQGRGRLDGWFGPQRRQPLLRRLESGQTRGATGAMSRDLGRCFAVDETVNEVVDPVGDVIGWRGHRDSLFIDQKRSV
jgi:hypothetical protein